MRTFAYIDGFNLYFGCLKRARHFRWLDVEALARYLCGEINPFAEILSVKYFTAPIKAKLSPRGDESCRAQQDYLLSLRSHCPNLEIIEGEYFIASSSLHERTEPIDFQKKVDVWRAEEKQTDVNIALHMLSDATDGLCAQQVLFSNDSDCVPILKTIRRRHPAITLGVIAPISLQNASRKPSVGLTELSDWSSSTISDQALLNCQLPARVTTRKRVISRPAHWR